jgi:hypothetical protein
VPPRTDAAAFPGPAAPRRPLRAAGAVAATTAAVSAAAVLFRFDPLAVDFYPRCPLFVLTGIYCPGCGALRAGHAALNGDLLAALDFNPLLVLAGPVLAYVMVARGLRWLAGRPVLPTRDLTGGQIMGVFWVLMLYTLARNLPWAPFTYLAP